MAGEYVIAGDLLPQAWVDEPGNGYQIDQLLDTGTIVRLPDADPPSKQQRR